MKCSYINHIIKAIPYDSSDSVLGSMPKARTFERGFSLFEALIAALIVAIAVAGVMKLHNHNIQQTAGNAELQRAQRILFNAQQRYQIASTLNTSDLLALNQQAEQIGLEQKDIKIVDDKIVLSWQAWSPEAVVTRDGCKPAGGATSCISVGVKKP